MQPKRRWAPKASRFGWPTIAPPSSRDYALKKYRVDRYHAKTHRSRFLIENDILASIAKGLEPGDTRYMSPCRWCWLHQDHLRARHFYPDWHRTRLYIGVARRVRDQPPGCPPGRSSGGSCVCRSPLPKCPHHKSPRLRARRISGAVPPRGDTV